MSWTANAQPLDFQLPTAFATLSPETNRSDPLIARTAAVVMMLKEALPQINISFLAHSFLNTLLV
jgi:hypothetical protein